MSELGLLQLTASGAEGGIYAMFTEKGMVPDTLVSGVAAALISEAVDENNGGQCRMVTDEGYMADLVDGRSEVYIAALDDDDLEEVALAGLVSATHKAFNCEMYVKDDEPWFKSAHNHPTLGTLLDDGSFHAIVTLLDMK